MSLKMFVINGNLVRDPAVSEDGKYGFITVATQKNYKNKEGKYDAEFHRIMISGEKLAKFYATHFKKGDGVNVVGEITTKPNKYDPEGKATEESLITYTFPSFAVGKKSGGASNAQGEESTTPADEFEFACADDDDLPF